MRITSMTSPVSPKARTAAILAGCALLLSGFATNNNTAVPEYSESSTSDSAQKTVTETVTETSSAQKSDESKNKSASSSTTSNSAGADENKDNGDGDSSNVSRADFQKHIYNQLRSGKKPGDTIDIDGEDRKVIVVGDGYGIGVVAASSTTSEDFAKEVFRQQINGLNATEQSLRENLKPTVQAHSEATGQTYTMRCHIDDRDLIICKGGKNAIIYMY